MNAETEVPSLTEILTRESQPDESPPGDVSVFPCPKCGKEFKSGPAIRMHTIRMHGRGWSTTQNFKGKRRPAWNAGQRQTEEERLAKKRAYNRKYRLRKGMAVRPQSFIENRGNVKRKVGGYKGMSMPKWSLARRRKFNAKQKAALNHSLEPAKPKPAPVVQSSVTFSPRCGCNIEVVRKAIEFADRV